jgi:hypothetical protein
MKFRLFASSMLALVTTVTLTALPATAHGDGHPMSGSFSVVVENNTGYIADPDYLFTECANPYNPEALGVEVQTPEYLYWLLWASIPLAAVGLFLLLRSKNKGSGNNRKDPKKKAEN